MDKDKLIAEVMLRTGIRLTPDDPVFALVALNQVLYEDAIDRTGARLDPLADRIDKAARIAAAEVTKTTLKGISEETRQARAILQEEAQAAAARVSAEADAARRAAATAIEKMVAAQKTSSRVKMAIVGGLVALLIAVCAGAVGYALGVQGQSNHQAVR